MISKRHTLSEPAVSKGDSSWRSKIGRRASLFLSTRYGWPADCMVVDVTSPSASPLQIVMAPCSPSTTAQSQTAEASQGGIPDPFNLLLAEIFPVVDNIDGALDERIDGEPTAPSTGRSPRNVRSPETLKRTEESSALWLHLYPLATPQPFRPQPGFGTEAPILGTIAVPPTAVPVGDRPPPAGNQTSFAGANSRPETLAAAVSNTPVGAVPESEAALRAPEPPIVLQGSMNDSRPLAERSPTDTFSAIAPPVEPLKTEGYRNNKVTGELPSVERPETKESAKSGTAPTDQQCGDGESRDKATPTQHEEPTGPLVSDPLWKGSHSYLLPPRSDGNERNATKSPVATQIAPRVPISDPGSEVPSNPPRSLTVRIQEVPGRPVDVRFVETNGNVKVTVRTDDTRLATALATELPKFERGLESRGWSSEFRVPNRVSETKAIEEILISHREATRSELPVAGAILEHPEGSPDRRRRTNWDEEVEDRTVAAALRRLSNQGADL